MTDELLVRPDGALLEITFNRPAHRNAMTVAMYEGLYAACERADADDMVRVLVLRVQAPRRSSRALTSPGSPTSRPARTASPRA